MTAYQINKLAWDTQFFGLASGKVLLFAALTESQFEKMTADILAYQFVTINNINNDPQNNYLLGKYTEAFLVDLNFQFIKENISFEKKIGEQIQVLEINDSNEILAQLEAIASKNFIYSRFFNDPFLDRKKASQIYLQWVKNAANDPQKKILYYLDKNKVNGFLVYSTENQTGILELIAVDETVQGKKVGTKLIEAFEILCNCAKTQVGTQADNLKAIQFYIRNGYRLVSRHSIYHIWVGNNEKN